MMAARKRLAVEDDDGLGIPEFLRVTPEEAARRKKWNAEHPVVAMPLYAAPSERPVDEEAARFVEEQAAEKKAKERTRLDALSTRNKFKAEAAARGEWEERLSDRMQWDGVKGKWIFPNQMPDAKYQRLLAGMPDEKHRQAFIKMFGKGHATPAAVASAPARKAAKPAAAAAPAKAKRPAAAKVAKPAAAPVAKPAKAAGPKLSKDEQAAKVEAMLTRPEGATLGEIGKEMGWLEHSASAFLSTQFRNKGRATSKEKVARGTVYRLDGPRK